ncbi:hypothetical protein [Tateyamaria sp.]|uniref:hypothetical protein n=1 Tax=Tateyamaria sp. TaxID=1929288 RepID=UPI003B226211
MEIAINFPDGRQMLNTTPELAAQANVPQELIDAAVLSERRKVVGKECESRIFAVASRNAQANMALALGVISAKSASSRSAAEQATLAGAGAGLQWVMEMRAAFAALVADPEADFHADAMWPEVPEEVVAVAGQF